MLAFRLRKATLAVGLLALVPAFLSGQTRDVVAKEVSVGRTEASLTLEFADGDRLEISFDRGDVVVDGDVVGSYTPGGALEDEWRSLLAEAVRLEDGPLSEMLADWTVPANLSRELADVAREVDRALEDALNDIDIRFDADDSSVSISVGDQGSLVELILSSVGRLGVLEDALQGIDDDLQVYIREDLLVPENTEFDRSIVMIDGTITVEGTVEGDVILVRGELELEDGGEIEGSVRVADGRVVRNEGRVRGEVVYVEDEAQVREAQLREELREEIAEELRGDLRNEIRNVTTGDDSFEIMAPFRPVITGMWGVVESLFTILILAIVGVGVLFFAGDNLEVIASTAKESPGRSAMVGMAGSFLLVPVWILGTIALAVSIVGIPVLIAWVPLFPIAAVAAGVIGYLAVAQNTGEWLADSEYPWTGWIRRSNSWMTILGGLVGLMLAFILSNVVSMAPFLGFFSGLLAFVGGVITFLAIQVGFGAVLLTRAGRRTDFSAGYDPDAAWDDAINLDDDLGAARAAKGEDDDA